MVSRLLKESLQKQTDEAFPDQSVAKQVDDTVPPEEVGLLKEAKEFALDATPVVGEVRAAKRIYDAVKNRNLVEAGVEALGLGLGLIPGVGDVAAKGVRGAYKAIKGADFQNYVPEKTRTAYKLFVKGDDEKLYPLFVNATKEVPKDKWIEADFPSAAFKAKNGKMYVPSKGGKRQATKYYDAEGSEISKKEYDSLGANQKEFASVVKGEQAKGTGVAINIPDEATRKKLIDEGYITEKAGKTKEAPHGKVTAVAARPGWHASQMPVATHIGPQDIKINIEERLKLLKAGITPEAIKRRGKQYYVKRRAEDHVYAEVQMADDVNYQTALLNSNKTDINNFVPRGGSYKYVDGQADSDKWVVGGDIKVTKVLSREESRALQKKLGVKDLPYRSEIEAILGKKFNEGGLAGGKTMYEGVDDYQLNSMGEDMAENTTEKQMNFAFMQEGGVLADDGVDRDPVSGNEVPSGSMAEEVRDDIPAMLSEGEYVVPADVVRYHGIQTFEDLRNEAKVGLQRMEADGRIGGQPVQEQDELPFSVEELQVTEAYRGGIMGFQSGGDTGSYEEAFGQSYVPNQRYGSMGASGLGFQLRNFTSSKTGKKITVPFFNGKPMQYIPPEYTASDVAGSGVTGAVSDDASRQEDEAEKARLVNQFGTSPTELTPLAKGIVDKVIAGEGTRQQGKSFDQYTSQDWSNYIRNADSKTADVTSKLPVIGLLQRMSEKAARSFAKTALRAGKNPATEQPLSTEEKLTLERVLMVAPNTSMTESIINAVTGRGETIQGLPLTEQAGFEFGDPITEQVDTFDGKKKDVTYKPVTKMPDDLLPDLSSFKEAEPTGPFYKAGETDATVIEKDLDPAVTQQNIVQTEQVDDLPDSPEKDSLIQKLKDVGYSVLTKLSPVGPTFGGGLEGLDFSALDSEAYNVGLRDYNALSDKEQSRVKRLVRSEAIGEGDLGMAAVFRSVLTRYGLTKTGAVPLNTFNPGINLSGTNTQAPAALTKENLTFNDIIDGRRAKRDGNVIFQYSPVDDKSINKPLTKTQREAVDRSITLATNTTEFAKELYKQNLNQDQVFEIINATNFRRFDAPGADAGNPKLFDHLFDSGGNQPFKANVQQIKDLTNKALQLDKPTQEYYGPEGFQNIIKPQPVDTTGLYGRGFTPSDIQPLEIEEMDLPPAEGVTPAVEVIEGGTTGSKARRDTQLRPDTQTGVNQFLTPTDVSAGSAARIDDDMARAGFGSVSASTFPDALSQQELGFADTTPADPYAPPDQPRQVTDPKAFLRRREQDRLKAEAAEKARLEAEAAEKARLEAEAAERARLQRIAQEKKIYEETQARIAKQMKDAAIEQQQKKARLEAEAAEKARLEALKKDREERDRIKKTNQMNQARNEVIMAGGDPFEADKAAHAVFLDQSDAIRRNEELNRGKTLTQVIQEENRREEDSGGGSGGGGGFGGGSSGGDDKIVCTEMYRQTQLVDWQKAMKIWDVYQRRYLTPEHQIGYHWLFKPYVKGMQRNRLLTKLGAILAKRRTQHLKHILTKGKAKDDLVGKLWCSIIHPIVHKAGKIKNFLDSKTKAT